MSQTIERRIDRIRRGEVPEKYRKRVSGIAPCDWAEYSLGEIYKERKLAGDPKLPVLTVSIHSGVSDGALNENELGKKVKRIEDKTQYKTAKAGDLVFNMMRAWQGAIGVARSDGLVSPAYIVAKPEHEVFPLFMDYYMKQPRMVNMIHRQSYGVTDFRLRLYWDSFAQIQISLPPLAEQKRIVEILSTQDRIIELLEKKVEQLELLKKSYMQKMFPQPGSNKPEIRFPGFTAPWEQRKLGKCFIERKESMPDGELISVTIGEGIKWFSELGRQDNSNDDKSKYKKVCVGDIAYNSMRMWQGASGYSPYEGIVSPAYTVLSPVSDVVDSKCISYLFKRHDMTHIFQIYSQGITSDNWNLKYPALSDIEIMVSPYLEEQHQIADYLSKLDDLITLHQRKRDEEIRKKQAMMQLLLMGIVRTNE